MAFGLQILNESSYVQIDQDYQNHVVVASGQASTNTQIAYPTGYDRLLIFVSPVGYSTTTYFFLDLWNVPAGNFKIGAITDGGGLVSTTVNYIITGVMTSGGAGSGFGLEVYRDDGKVAFSSDRAYLRVLAYAGLSGTVSPASYLDLVVTSGAKTRYGLLTGCIVSGFNNAGGSNYVKYSAAFRKTDANTFRYKAVVAGTGVPVSQLIQFLGSRPCMIGEF